MRNIWAALKQCGSVLKAGAELDLVQAKKSRSQFDEDMGIVKYEYQNWTEAKEQSISNHYPGTYNRYDAKYNLHVQDDPEQTETQNEGKE